MLKYIFQFRFAVWNAYDILFTLAGKERDNKLFSWICDLVKRLMPKLQLQGLCNPRQSGYTRLFARCYTLHAMVTALFQGFDVPTSEQIADMKALLAPGDDTSEQFKAIKALEDLIYAPGTLHERPKNWAERLLTHGDWLCKEGRRVEFYMYFYYTRLSFFSCQSPLV